MQTPSQLCQLVTLVNETADVEGAILEIGCSSGATTIFLNQHLNSIGLEKPYICIDTFSGFTQEDIAEERARGNALPLTKFRANSSKRFERTMELNRVQRVEVVKGDISEIELPVDKVSFCLIDVDLYRPVLAALEKVWPRLAYGGVLVVDDVSGKSFFRNAVEAYKDFVSRHDLPANICHDQGILRKPRA